MFSPSSSSFFTALRCWFEQATCRGEPCWSITWSTSAPYWTRGSMHSGWPEHNFQIICWHFSTPGGEYAVCMCVQLFQRRFWVRINGMWPLTFGCRPVDWRVGVAAPRGVSSMLKEQRRQGHMAPGAGFWQRSDSIHCWAVNLTNSLRRLLDCISWTPLHECSLC